MIIKTHALVIREQPYAERDRLVTLLTKELGIIRAFVNGARSPKSKNAAATGLLCFSSMSISKNAKGVYTVREAQALEVFFPLRSDIVRLSLAQYFAQIAYELSPREEAANEALRLTLNALHLICVGERDLRLIKAAFELRMLSVSGYMPAVVACDLCGEYETDPMYLSVHTGKLYCSGCAGREKTEKLSLSVVRAVRHICLCENDKVFSFKLSDQSLDCLGQVSEKYLKNVTMRGYQTLAFYKQMTN